MTIQEMKQVSLNSFRERSEGKQVVLLYPWTNYRNLFLSHFLSSAKEGLLYYRIPSEATDLSEWLEHLAAEFDDVLGGFGKNLRAVLSDAKPKKLGEALAQDLIAYSNDPLVLFIDELDRIPIDANFSKFILSLVQNIKGTPVQIAFSSRLLLHQPWYDMVEKGDAIVLGTENRKNDMMFTIEDTIKPQLEVYALGRGHAYVNGNQITNWDGALPRNLFFYFIDHELLSRDNIFKTFWPNLKVKEATNVYHVTKRKISERISMKVGDGKNYELTQYIGGFYKPSDKVVRHYDVAEFQDAVERALMTTDDREEERLLTRAIELYKAPFLQHIDMDWVIQRRNQLRAQYAQALISMGRICRRRGEDEHALGYFTRAVKEAPEREDIHRDIMTLYIEKNMADDAKQQYERLAKILKETLDIEPSRELRTLYQTLS